MRKIYQYNEELFTKETPEFMYFLGLIASDGTLEKYHIKIALSARDKQLLEILRDVIVPGKPLYYEKRCNEYVLKISNKKIQDFVRSYGITENKTFTLDLDEKIINSPYFDSFLRGYFDGDGCITTAKHNKKGKLPLVQIVCASKIFLERLIYTLSTRYNFNKNKVRSYSYWHGELRKCIFSIIYTCGQARKFYDFIYQNITNNLYMVRKYDKFTQILTNFGW